MCLTCGTLETLWPSNLHLRKANTLFWSLGTPATDLTYFNKRHIMDTEYTTNVYSSVRSFAMRQLPASDILVENIGNNFLSFFLVQYKYVGIEDQGIWSPMLLWRIQYTSHFSTWHHISEVFKSTTDISSSVFVRLPLRIVTTLT